MKKLGRITILSTREYESLVCKYEDAGAAAGDLAEELNRMRNTLGAECTVAYNAGKFHSAGGYSHTLPKLKEQLSQATALLKKWQPLVEALETTPGQFTETA